MSSECDSRSQPNENDGRPSHALNNTRTSTFAKGVVMSDSDTTTLDDSNHSCQSRASSVHEGRPLKRPIDVRPILEKLNIDQDHLALVKHLFPNRRHDVPIEPVVINMNELNYKMCGERLVIIDQMIESMYRHGKSAQADASANRLRNERLKVEEEMRELVMQMNKSKSSSRPDNTTHKQGGVGVGGGGGGGGSRSSSRRDQPKSTNKSNMPSKDSFTSSSSSSSSSIAPGSGSSSSAPMSTDAPVSSAYTRPNECPIGDIRIKRPRSGTTTQQEIEVADILVSLMS